MNDEHVYEWTFRSYKNKRLKTRRNLICLSVDTTGQSVELNFYKTYLDPNNAENVI